MALSKNDICNLALSDLGNFESINDIDNPKTKFELTCALWYNTARRFALKMSMPNFATTRRYVSQKVTTPEFGYAFEYEYPSDCLRVLGINNIDEKSVDYAVEGNSIMHDENFTPGMPLRFIKDVVVIDLWTPETVVLVAKSLAQFIALPCTQSVEKKKAAEAAFKEYLVMLTGVNAQENPPVRVSQSKFKQARYGYAPTITNKK